MSSKSAKVIRFAGSAVAVEHEGERAARIVDFLFRHAGPEINHDIPADITYRLVPGEEPDNMVLYREEMLLDAGTSEADLAERLLGSVCHDLADKSRGGLLFHSAALILKNNKGLVLPGGIAAGKTTLAFWLAMKGSNYLTDEMVFVADGADAFQAFGRPLNLKEPARLALEKYFNFEQKAGQCLRASRSTLISPELLGSGASTKETPISLIVFPGYREAGDSDLKPLTKAQAGLALMECLVNARNLPDHGLSEILRLVKMVPAFQLRYSHFDQLGKHLETLLRILT